MNFNILLSIIYLTSTVIIYSPTRAYALVLAECQQKSQDIQSDANKLAQESNTIQNVATQQAGNAAGTDINTNSHILAQMSAGSCDLNNQTVAKLQEAHNACAKECDGTKATDLSNPKNGNQDEGEPIDEERKKCQSKIDPLINAYRQAAADACGAVPESQKVSDATNPENQQGGEGGGMSPMMAGLLGAALGAGAAMLLNKDKDKKKGEDKAKDENPENEDGTVDCTKSGSEIYSDCNEYYIKKCESDPSLASCKSFAGRYCISSGSNASNNDSNSTVPATSQSGIIIASAEDKNIKGEGVGTQFCFTSQATDFCKVAGRETCPSCLQLETNRAPACKNNPTLCLAQNTLPDIEASKASCPSDPLFSNPEYMAGGGSKVPGSDSLDDPIIPGQYSSSGDSTSLGDGAGGINYSDTGNHSVIGYGADGESAGNGSGQNSGTSGGSNGETGRSGLPDPILPSGVVMASLSRSPTSAGGSMGPSLFSMSSALIESRCKNRQLAHCSR